MGLDHDPAPPAHAPMTGLLGGKRARALARNRTARYLLYALGEIVLIVIGILLALQVDSWREEQANTAREADVLAQIRADLQKDISELDRFVDSRINRTVPYLTSVYEKEWDTIPLDSLQLIGTTYFAFLPFTSAYEGLKSSGDLSAIRNGDLRDDIISYYEREHLHLADWSAWHMNFVINSLEPYMFNELAMDPRELVADLDHLKERLEGRRLNSLIATQIGSLNRLRVEIRAVTRRAEYITALIDRELTGSS
jgi:hypothetical protein